MRLFEQQLSHNLAPVINVKNKELAKALGVRIQNLRKKQGLSQLALANEADIPLSQIGRIERGENNPTISTLYVIAIALGVELKTLVDVKL
jgi:transcriptional regulator with XRE-family HTH domain